MRQDSNLVIPVKGIETGKSRLAPCLDQHQRETLIHWLLNRTILLVRELVQPANAFVLSPDASVLNLARNADIQAVYQATTGLNEGLSELKTRLQSLRTVIIPVDLPYLMKQDIMCHMNLSGIGISPDGRRTGTNMLSMPEPGAIDCLFGPSSFQSHHRAAILSGLPVTVIDRARIRFDLDTPDDLAAWEDRQSVLSGPR